MNNSLSDSEILLDEYNAMRSHIAAVRGLDPKVAQQLEATYKAGLRPVQRIQARAMFARLVLMGQYDDLAIEKVTTAGTKSLVDMVIGQRPMPEAVRRFLDSNY